MLDCFGVKEGDYGRIELIRHHHDLVMRAHAQSHFAFWVYGGEATSQVGNHTVTMGPDVDLGVNSNASHDLRWADTKHAVVFLNLYLNDDWLDAQFKGLAHSVVLPHAWIQTKPSIREACAHVVKQFALLLSEPLFLLRLTWRHWGNNHRGVTPNTHRRVCHAH